MTIRERKFAGGLIMVVGVAITHFTSHPIEWMGALLVFVGMLVVLLPKEDDEFLGVIIGGALFFFGAVGVWLEAPKGEMLFVLIVGSVIFFASFGVMILKKYLPPEKEGNEEWP